MLNRVTGCLAPNSLSWVSFTWTSSSSVSFHQPASKYMSPNLGKKLSPVILPLLRRVMQWTLLSPNEVLIHPLTHWSLHSRYELCGPKFQTLHVSHPEKTHQISHQMTVPEELVPGAWLDGLGLLTVQIEINCNWVSILCMSIIGMKGNNWSEWREIINQTSLDV